MVETINNNNNSVYSWLFFNKRIVKLVALLDLNANRIVEDRVQVSRQKKK